MTTVAKCHCLAGDVPNPECFSCGGTGEMPVVDHVHMVCTQCHMPWAYIGQPSEGETRDNLCPGCGAPSEMVQ